MTKCYKCDGETKRQEVTWSTKIGEHEVSHRFTTDVCTVCGEWGIESRKLGELELWGAATVLQEHEMTGAVLKDARKALALKQTELAEYLGVTSETVSRWERGERPMEPWVRLAMIGLVWPKVMPSKFHLVTIDPNLMALPREAALYVSEMGGGVTEAVDVTGELPKPPPIRSTPAPAPQRRRL